MANTTKTVTGRNSVALTSATNTLLLASVTVSTSPGQGGLFSLHDCASVGAVSLANCVWPIGEANAAGTPGTPLAPGQYPSTQAMPYIPGSWNDYAMTFTQGITIFTPSDTGLGVFVIVFS
jgi:hypothetical protein